MASSLGAGNNKVRYSELEKRMFDAIPKRGRINTTDLIEIYWDRSERPRNDRVAAMGCLRSLKKKINDNREPFKLNTSRRAGPKPLDVWFEKRRR